MKEITKTVYEAFDGKPFDTAAECRNYEKENIHLALVGLTVEQVEAALNRSDPELCEAIEQVAYRVRQARIAAGELKRERRKGEPAAEAVAPTPQDEISNATPPEQPTEAGQESAVHGEEMEMPGFLNRAGAAA